MLIRWSPYSDFANIFQSFDNLVRQTAGEGAASDTAGDTLSQSAWSTRAGFPAVETFRRGDNLVLRAELPGIDPKDIEMTVEDGRLTLKGEKKQERRQEDTELYVHEVSYGRFERTFRLPRGVKAEQLKANHENGVLTVTIPAHALEDASRRVPIQIGTGSEAASGKKEVAKSA